MVYVQKENNNINRQKKCNFCKAKIAEIDYKNTTLISRYLNRWNQIDPSARTGTCAQHQRQLTTAIKRARHLALLPFVVK